MSPFRFQLSPQHTKQRTEHLEHLKQSSLPLLPNMRMSQPHRANPRLQAPLHKAFWALMTHDD